jgi:dihydrofolate reductase
MSVSLDGFIAGPNDGPGNGLGDGGEALHEWFYGLRSWREAHGKEGGEGGRIDQMVAEAYAGNGAAVIGRRMFDNAEEAWGDEPPFDHPIFVLTHRPRESFTRGGTEFHFVDGVESAGALARAAAGDRDVGVAGGQTIQGFLSAGLLDEVSVHVVPVFLGGGRPLFSGLGPQTPGELRCTSAEELGGVVHLRFAVEGRD